VTSEPIWEAKQISKAQNENRKTYKNLRHKQANQYYVGEVVQIKRAQRPEIET